MTAVIGAHIERQYRKIDGLAMAGNVTEYYKRNALCRRDHVSISALT